MALDLKPISEETIKELGITPQDLWMVQINDVTYGPFETLSLKHYCQENESLFFRALASRVNEDQWIPFRELDAFKNKDVSASAQKRFYWLLVEGQKTASLRFEDVDKKIESKSIIMTDLISSDDGLTWKKIFQLGEFHHRFQNGTELPEAPGAELPAGVLKPISKGTEISSTKLGSTSVIKLDELSMDDLKETAVSRSLKWALPVSVAVIAGFGVLGYYFLNPMTPQSADQGYEADGEKKRKVVTNNNSNTPMPLGRTPASAHPAQVQDQRSALTSAPNYREVHVETHDNNFREPHPEPVDPLLDPAAEEVKTAQHEEHSLVNNPPPSNVEDQQMDQPAPEQREPASDPSMDNPPPVIESSDF